MILHTPRLTLRELELADAPLMNEYEGNPESVRYTTQGVRTLAQTEERIRVSRDAAAQAPRRLFDLAVVLEGSHIGRVGFAIGKPDDRQATLWYHVHPRACGRGIALEAAGALRDFAFRELDLHRVWLDADPRNQASVRVAEKLGMRREAHHVEDAFVQGEWTDSVIYAQLAREWRAAQ